jgi:hypothetical protein
VARRSPDEGTVTTVAGVTGTIVIFRGEARERLSIEVELSH